ncbi:MAG: ABC transporter substrate-binding protein [Balneolaceae bacterium]
MMKYSFLSVLFLLLSIASVQAQSFEDGLDFYESGDYEQAVEIFEGFDDERSSLFTGKSYFALGEHVTANAYFKELLESNDRSIRQEAKYTLALSHFGMKNFTKTLDTLYELMITESRTGVHVDANRFYRQVMGYLTPEQRFEAVKHTEHQAVAVSLIENVKNRIDRNIYQIMVNEVVKAESDSLQKEDLRERLSSRSNLQGLRAQYPSAPDGIVYNIGVVLPVFEEQSSEFTIPRNLYFGITLAAEEFNSRHSNKKVRLHFKSSGQDVDTTATNFTELVWANHIDAVIGPLFSDPAKKLAELSEEYSVPMLAPLANADDINLDYNYTFQLNPTFEIHGRQMARHAVQNLGLDTLAVITQKDALGTASALGFRHEAEKLGAHISYYIEEDFAATGFDLSEFTKVFSTDSLEIEEEQYIPSQGVYAPFTGQAANTLIRLFMTDLEAMNNRMVVLGSEEWETADLTGWVDRNIDVYHSKAFGASADSATTTYVEQDFETRFGLKADQFAKIGFDAGTYLFQSLDTAGNPRYLKEVLMQSSTYEGLALRVAFNNSRVNQHIYILPLSESAKSKVEDNPILEQSR